MLSLKVSFEQTGLVKIPNSVEIIAIEGPVKMTFKESWDSEWVFSLTIAVWQECCLWDLQISTLPRFSLSHQDGKHVMKILNG